jgi:glycosidase
MRQVYILMVLLGAVAALPVAAAAPAGLPACSTGAWHGEQEVYYKIFVRSFADSNGDRVGDFRGIEQRLPYLQSLGVTTLLLTPIVPSSFYHNYFASQFDGVDPAFGSLADFHQLVRALHARGMKIILDQEIQYVPDDHPWWAQAAGHPESPRSSWILYNGAGNTQPETGFLGDQRLKTYDERDIRLAMLNLDSPEVRSYFGRLLRFWLQPNDKGKARDGVDGFRIDHMMDDLDNRGRLTNLVAGFWAPLAAQARALDPQLTMIAEQADWASFGEDLQARGGIDTVYAFPLRKAMASLDRDAIAAALTATQAKTAPGKGQLLFVENHDTNRFASEVGGDARKERLGAALVTLLKGSPMLYYGQELGMQGRQLHLANMADGNDIPVREALHWSATEDGPGTATWYRGTGPWWTDRYGRDHDGISVQEQARDPGSLLAFYRRALALRHARAELRAGSQCVLDAGEPSVLVVQRGTAPSASLLLVNFADRPVQLALPATGWHSWAEGARPRVLLASGAQLTSRRGTASAQLGPHSMLLLTARP